MIAQQSAISLVLSCCLLVANTVCACVAPTAPADTDEHAHHAHHQNDSAVETTSGGLCSHDACTDCEFVDFGTKSFYDPSPKHAKTADSDHNHEHLNDYHTALNHAQQSLAMWEIQADSLQAANLYKYIGLLELVKNIYP